MGYDYGYGKLENELFELLISPFPDFAKAKELINQGADLNAAGVNLDENILSEILLGYEQNVRDNIYDEYESKDINMYNEFYPAEMLDSINYGENMCATIEFFLSNGFDVNKFNGCYGAQCLHSLVLSTYDRYFIKATKMLFDAGAVNRSLAESDDESTPLDFVCMEGSYQRVCVNDIVSRNIFKAVEQIYI